DPATGQPLSPGAGPTLQTHLCLLPSQLSTYLRYITFAVVSIAILAIRAFLVPIMGLKPFALEPDLNHPALGRRNKSVLLPVFKAKLDDYDEYTLPRGFSKSHFLDGNSHTRGRSGSGSAPSAGG